MAEMQTADSGARKKGGKVRSKKMSTRVDLTPMVDLGFLLITFFMLTTTLAKPQIMPVVMPEKDIKSDFKDGVTINLLADLKRKWKVSMQALLYRANDIGVITDNQKRYLVNQFNSMNIRRREPAELDIPREQPMKLRDLITKYKNKQRLNVKQLALFFNSNEDEFLSKYS